MVFIITFGHFMAAATKSTQITMTDFTDAVLTVGHHIIQSDDSGRTDTLTKRTVKLTSTVFAFMVFTMYCSLLTSSMTVAPKLPSILTFDEMYRQVGCVGQINVLHVYSYENSSALSFG